jgi:hypothetical protein
MSGINLINVSDKELIAEMKKRFIIIGFYNKDDIDVDGLDKYSYEEINKHLTTCDIDGDYHYQEIREALMEKFGDERESDEEEEECEFLDEYGVRVIWNKETEGWDCIDPYCRECGKPDSDVEIDRFVIENEVFICKGCIKK